MNVCFRCSVFIIHFFLFFNSTIIVAQDTTYARQVIKKLTSSEFLGRGYVKDGVNKAASFLSGEMKQIGLSKFGKTYSQTYSFNVNTFPSKMSVVLDGRELTAGKHYLIYPSATTKKTGSQLF
jgi:aminopeptidase YwaD